MKRNSRKPVVDLTGKRGVRAKFFSTATTSSVTSSSIRYKYHWLSPYVCTLYVYWRKLFSSHHEGTGFRPFPWAQLERVGRIKNFYFLKFYCLYSDPAICGSKFFSNAHTDGKHFQAVGEPGLRVGNRIGDNAPSAKVGAFHSSSDNLRQSQAGGDPDRKFSQAAGPGERDVTGRWLAAVSVFCKFFE